MIDTGRRFVLGSADWHHQRQQMIFPWMHEMPPGLRIIFPHLSCGELKSFDLST